MTQAATQNATAVPSRSHLRTVVGMVTSAKRDKTRTVAVDYQYRHPKYGKYLHRTAKYQVHDEANSSKAGDRVEIAPCRPVSKTKSWRLVRVVQQDAAVPNVQETTTATEVEA